MNLLLYLSEFSLWCMMIENDEEGEKRREESMSISLFIGVNRDRHRYDDSLVNTGCILVVYTPHVRIQL